MSIDIEKLDNLPKRERLWEMYGCVERNYRTPLKVQQAHTIFDKSVGKSMSDIQKRIEDMIPVDETWGYFVSRQVEHVYFDDDGKVQLSPTRRYWNSSNGFHYIDQDNILRYRKPTFKKEPYSNSYHSETKKEEKERRRLRRNEGLAALKMINRPDLFNFYTKTKREYKEKTGELVSAELSYKYNEPKILAFPVKYSYERNRLSRALKTKPRIEELKNIIVKLESGDYSVFYISKAFLYSIGKECHHINI